MASSWGPSAAFEAYQEQTRRNLALFEQAMKMWTPFGTPPAGDAEPATKPAGETLAEAARDRSTMTDIEEMKSQLAAMQAKIEKLSSGGRS